ncbi:hypothetical protein [Vibrio harveyi]|uniref:Uncharacterized protein n=1 Tax=Vibrio harveyi TaxID=669 RepID=A0A8B3DKV3_VIBHA|nr:hypothetical protein [Vibrio harveyi]APP08121.1 hypothetical protein BG259_22955 [Vibrio harveyi]EKO3869515.1 hypothetical protein [Vibrio harveyi]EKY4193708.1 hypothetical protein [Vibrio harveyi]ELE7134542.1 hypothetical protein [Vibrio harveyi]ELY1985215.1 hypothetical protein [Vibrio harveyi]
MNNLAQITKELTLDELHELRDTILALSEAIKLVPSEFDASFQQKINRILDITSEMEQHSRKLRSAIEHSQIMFGDSLIQQLKTQHEQQLKAIDKQISNKLKGYIPINKGFFFTALFINALFVSSLLGVVFYLLAFVL